LRGLTYKFLIKFNFLGATGTTWPSTGTYYEVDVADTYASLTPVSRQIN